MATTRACDGAIAEAVRTEVSQAASIPAGSGIGRSLGTACPLALFIKSRREVDKSIKKSRHGAGAREVRRVKRYDLEAVASRDNVKLDSEPRVSGVLKVVGLGL